jgi:DNA mismatch repair protein MutL
VNQRLIRDRLILHAVSEAYRNVIPPTSFPVVLLFLEMPPHEVDVNVHPAKTEVRFRQQAFVHDFVRDSIRNTLVKARPAAEFLSAMSAAPSASAALMPDVSPLPDSDEKPDSEPVIRTEDAVAYESADAAPFVLTEPELPPVEVNLPFAIADGAAVSGAEAGAAPEFPDGGEAPASLNALASLKPMGQLRESFILAVNDEGLWIVDQHVAHERVLFEKILREREVEKVERQRLLMPLLIELLPQQMVLFSEIAGELERNGFEVEPFGPHTIAVKAAPLGLEPARMERMLMEVLEQAGNPAQSENLGALRTRIAASLACHSAIKVNMSLDSTRMEWLLGELAKTEHPTSCPHGRPIALRYSWKDIQKAFNRS